MSMKVQRHGRPGPDDEGYARALGEGVARTVRRLERSPRMFDAALDKALTHVQARCAVDPDGAELDTWEAVVSAMQIGSAMFAAASVTEGTVECRINHEMRTIPATGAQPYADAGNWLSAFWFAVICRDQARMTQLCEVPVDLLRASGAECDEYIYHWVDSLQTYWLERPGLAEKLTSAIEKSHPDVARIVDQDLLDKILYQPINLFYRFLRKDHDGFNQALTEALEAHKAYWTASEERDRSVAGYLALGPLAITCLAYDAGRPIEVESDYIPKHLLTRGWVGEFPT
ncbi:immunity 49 family protein [Streptomyces sp. SCA3-4]|uniref:immunity 49 family protein n=1 Tax=Streptomyces sichuanensis TaxID=2871810 RepID=UPI001CE246AA|nr:immunity 49 family protein [Streptomyces sichuanensis]MCA6094092.1 immunity 49 family protein [Streptomyces sichuanensis]